MNTKQHHPGTALLLAALALLPGLILAQGSLTPPPGAPAPTMRTLEQIEPRIPISTAPFNINTPGSYYLTANLTVTTGNAITINVDNVTLDLNGFTISSTAASANGSGIGMLNNLRNLTFKNGSIKGGVINTGGGTYAGSGFAHGIFGSPGNAHASNINVSGCLQNGIYLEGASSAESCTVRTTGNYGIVAPTVSNCVALDCGVYGVAGEQISNSRGEAALAGGVGLYAFKQAQNCHGSAAGNGTGLNALSAMNCSGGSSSGIGLSATNALNCQSFSGSGTGLSAVTAMNCQGASTTGPGLVASITATGCFGSSSGSAVGLSAITAMNCQGVSTGATGLFASRAAQNCYGSGSTGISLSTSGAGGGVASNCFGISTGGGNGIIGRIVIGCYGQSPNGYGINTYIANSCDGVGSPLGVTATYKHNMVP